MALSPQERGKLGAQKRWGNDAGSDDNERPRYRLTAKCYLDDVILDPADQPKDDSGEPKPLYYETDTEYPAWYMEPVNEAAHAMCAKHPPVPYGDPINTLTQLR